MTICNVCSAQDKLEVNRQMMREGKAVKLPQYGPLKGPGWHREGYWHRMAAHGHKVPKVR